MGVSEGGEYKLMNACGSRTVEESERKTAGSLFNNGKERSTLINVLKLYACQCIVEGGWKVRDENEELRLLSFAVIHFRENFFPQVSLM